MKDQQTSAQPAAARQTPIVTVSAGAEHSLYITSDGKLWAMGPNNCGQLGDGTDTQRHSPVQIASNVTAAAAGGEHSLYVTSDGKLWAMGQNGCGQLGDGTDTRRHTPVQIASNVSTVAAGTTHSLYITRDGNLWGMGGGTQIIEKIMERRIIRHIFRSDTFQTTVWRETHNQFGDKLGDNTTLARGMPTLVRRTPVQIASNVIAVAAGETHSLYVTRDGALWTMGQNEHGQLGDGTSCGHAPMQIASNVSAVAAGSQHSLYVTNDGKLWAMGQGDDGQLGDGNTLGSFTPVQIASDVIAVAAGAAHSLYVTRDGKLWGMGRNSSAQLGDCDSIMVDNMGRPIEDKRTLMLLKRASMIDEYGTPNFENQPAPVQIASDVIAVAAGDEHSLYITRDGKLWAMGTGPAVGSYTPVPVETRVPETRPAAPVVPDTPEEQNHLTEVTIRREFPKVGRNDSCPCGSGKKFKNCHGKM